MECKKIRQGLGGLNSESIPDVLGEEDLSFHRECYQKFTYAKTLLKRKGDGVDIGLDGERGVKRISRNIGSGESSKTDSRGRFPNHCMICKKESLKVKGKRQNLSKIVTKNAETTLKKAAMLKNDSEMLIHVQDVDLIAKDFRRHDYCYTEYTRLWFGKREGLHGHKSRNGRLRICL